MTSRSSLCVVAVLALAAFVRGQNAPEPARITLPASEVRAGASPQFPVTGTLKMGDTVLIKKRDSRFVEIVPPAGSLSWIQDRLVKQIDPTTLELVVEEAPVRYGNSVTPAPLDIDSRQARVKRGARLTIRGAQTKVGETSWWPIEPIPGESRFIEASAITPTVAPPVETAPQAERTKSANTTSAPNAKPARPKEWEQAEQAEREGRYDDAIRIYTELARFNSKEGGDFTLAVLCQNRIRELSPLRRPTGTLTNRNTSTNGTRPDANYPPAPPLPGASSRVRVSTTRPASEPDGVRSSGPGYLRRAGIRVDGQTTYALENSRGDLLLYVTPEAGVNLETHINRRVELYGMIRNRGDVRGASHMYVGRVIELR